MTARFKVGDVAWVASHGNRQRTITCPVCFGKLVVRVVLGDGTEVETPCGYCACGYDGPTGSVTEYIVCGDWDSVVIDRVSSRETASGIEYEYHSQHSVFNDSNAFLTESEARWWADQFSADYKREQDTRSEYLKKCNHKSYSWNVGYHTREAKELRRRIEYHESRAVLCKAKAKEEKETK